MKDGGRVDERRHPQWHRGMKNMLRETFSHHQGGRQLAWSQPLSTPSELPHYHLFCHSIFRKARRDNQREGSKRGMGRRRQTPLIYVPLRNRDCISLSCAIVYCVWLSDEKNGTEERWAGCRAVRAALCVVACQHWWLSALTNLVTQTHNHNLTRAQRHPSFYTSNSGEVPNQTQKKDNSHLGTLTHIGINNQKEITARINRHFQLNIDEYLKLCWCGYFCFFEQVCISAHGES